MQLGAFYNKMISDRKLIEFYNKALEIGHPDPEKAVFGRAEMSNRKSDFRKGGRVGLFGVSSKNAGELGWEDLDNPDQNFNAAMDLDIANFDLENIADMYAKTAGITGGESKRISYNIELDESFERINSKIQYEDGIPVSISREDGEEDSSEESGILNSETKDDLVDETKRVSAGMQSHLLSVVGDPISVELDLERALQLLKEYINKSI